MDQTPDAGIARTHFDPDAPILEDMQVAMRVDPSAWCAPHRAWLTATTDGHRAGHVCERLMALPPFQVAADGDDGDLQRVANAIGCPGCYLGDEVLREVEQLP